MSMADDSTLRSYRSNDPHRRAAESQASDPLAELARLIGQSDPFAELGRGQQRQGSEQRPQLGRQAPRAAPPAASDDWNRAPAREPHLGFDDYASREAQSSYRDSHRETYREPYQEARQSSPHDVDQGASYDPRYGSSQDYADPQARGADGRRHDAYQDGQSYQADRPYQEDGHAYQDPYRDNRSYDDAHVGDRQGQQHADDRDSVRPDGRVDDDYYQDDVPLEPHEDEMYDDAPRGRRRGLATALALISCAMLGTAGAYAYRSYTGNSGSMQPPPVISADSSTPTKIVPASAGDAPSSKLIQDRLATAGNEQIVSKQEEPVALREPGTQANPRAVLPAPVAPGQGGTQQPSGVSNEPRKVRTVVIRPDGNDQTGRPVGALAAAPAPTRSAAPPPAPAPAPKAAAAPPARSGGPISLDRPASEPDPVPAERTRTAAVPPPTRAAPEPANTSGGFVVQLSSQKSEGEAQASFRILQGKFPNELGGRQPIVRRADLGSKGIVYRAMVGPFGSSQEASQFCTSYKAAGGQCFLPKE
jgi:sporulation related protein